MKLGQLISDIIVELTQLQGAALPPWREDDDFPFPRMIAVDGERTLYVSKKIDNLIDLVSHQIHTSDPDLGRRTGTTELRSIVRRAFGPALAAIDLDRDVSENADITLSSVRGFIKQSINREKLRQEHCFGCTLFSRLSVSDFAVGSVRFERRAEWLRQKLIAGDISLITHRRIEKIWSGRKLRGRKPSFESMGERDILDTIGDCPYVCSVTTDGYSLGLGREKALIAARLVLTSIALLWQTPSKKLDGFNLAYDRTVQSQIAMAFCEKNILTSRNKIHLTVDGDFNREKWDMLIAKSKDYFSIIEEIINYSLSLADVSRKHLMRTLFHALLWFHEGCRDRSPLIAIVKFAATMDALACGKGENDILKLFEVRVGLKGDARVFPDGTTLKSAVAVIYGYGRSRTIHGNNERVGTDWSNMSARAEQLARLCLIRCIEWADKNREVDSPRLMLTT
ncbi:hypothetical protein RFN29_32820 [Mesorhizobium sp. VK22B]|uniref:Apea-like HEPN domain-containing protein n=1 Tax=Mesorhizobium captivum TaxID=3072319 RepID=A0ABU4ZEC7_9HYPH|nr:MULTISPECIES: hypothetical protein [unclassified Mesorhizobium]MDX8496312.1 hypothetical protein [Mesorhizobium sp. VK22B]MDX8509693.1 hypothetical protein [Mesorhizobium sp. VK22E]